MQKVTPFLWFNNNAQEAAEFYASIFPDTVIASSNPEFVMFSINGQPFMALNGGPMYTFTEAISLFVNCESQDEVDELWERLSEGGSKGQCGWLKDKFGLSWQVIPSALRTLMSSPDPVKAARVMQAMRGMTKIIIADLQKAHDGE